jgi:hypothetical protein
MFTKILFYDKRRFKRENRPIDVNSREPLVNDRGFLPGTMGNISIPLKLLNIKE